MFNNLNPTTIAIFLVVLVIAITLHEMMHAFAAKALGDDTASDEGRISFNPLRHIDPLLTIALPLVLVIIGQPPILAAKPVPFRPDMVRFGDWGAALVALAGPFTNLVLAVIGAVVFQMLPNGTSSLVYNFVLMFVQLNIGLFVFNMIPFPPLDGSRLLYAVAPEGVRRVMNTIEGFGIFGLIILIVLLFPALSPVISNINNSLLTFLLN